MKNDVLTGCFARKLKQKADCIEKRRPFRKVRSVILFLVFASVCIGGIVIGFLNKSSELEKRYISFTEKPIIASVDFELLSYKDVAKIVEQYFLGNSPSQSLLGGYFCEKDGYIICPDENCHSTVLRLDDSEITLSDSIVSDVNIKNGTVYYRDQDKRKVFSYEISSCEKKELDLENIGQFALYDSDYIYIDLSNSSLIYANQTSKRIILVDGGVKSFAIAGNSVIYLDYYRTLYSLGLFDKNKTVIENSIDVFSIGSYLLLQNNGKLIQKELAGKSVSEFELKKPCNRLLGLTDSNVIFESSDGIYCHSIEKKTNTKLGSAIFIGASNNKALLFSNHNNGYFVIDLAG